jgi:hypothetical protein
VLSQILLAAWAWFQLAPADLVAQGTPPSITSISPSHKSAGRSDFVLTVNGTGFVVGAVVQWGSIPRDTTFVSDAKLTAVIKADDIAFQGDFLVTVSNPSPGSLSNAVTFTVDEAASITSISPSPITAGDPDFTLIVSGLGFEPGDQIQWNNQRDSSGNPVFKQTSFLSSTELHAQILAADIAQGAPDSGWSVLIYDSDGNPLPGAGAVVTSLNPQPLIYSFSPSSAFPGDRGLELTIRGSGFVQPVVTNNIPGTSVLWNGSERSSTIISSQLLVVTINAGDVGTPGQGALTVSNPNPGGGQSTQVYTITRFANFYFPRIVSRTRSAENFDDSLYDGIAVVNLDPTDTASLTLTAYDSQGTQIAGDGITNPATMSLGPGSQQAVVDTQLFGQALADRDTIGWMRVDSTAAGVVGFFLMFNSSLTLLDGADVGRATTKSFVFPEIEDQGVTQLHVVNTSEIIADVTFDLLSSAGVSRIGPVVRSLDFHAGVATSTTDLFPGVTRDASDYIRASSTQNVVAFESIGKGIQDVAGLNGQDVFGGATVLYSPQYVVGKTYRSTLSVINLESRPGTVLFEFYDDSGKRIGSQSRQIAARGKIYVSDQTFFSAVGNTDLQGYVKITSDGPSLAGSIVFGDPGRNTFLTALPLVSTLRTDFVFSQLASDETYFTGMAILNPNDSDVLAKIEIRDERGNLIATKTENIPGRARKTQLVTQFFPQLVGQDRRSGYIRVSTNLGVASFALYGTHNLSVLSALPPQPAP